MLSLESQERFCFPGCPAIVLSRVDDIFIPFPAASPGRSGFREGGALAEPPHPHPHPPSPAHSRCCCCRRSSALRSWRLAHAQRRGPSVTVRERRAPARAVRVTRKRSVGGCGCGGALHADSSPRPRAAPAPLPPCPAAPAPASTGTSPSSRPRAASTKSVRVRPAGPPRTAPSPARPASPAAWADGTRGASRGSAPPCARSSGGPGWGPGKGSEMGKARSRGGSPECPLPPGGTLWAPGVWFQMLGDHTRSYPEAVYSPLSVSLRESCPASGRCVLGSETCDSCLRWDLSCLKPCMPEWQSQFLDVILALFCYTWKPRVLYIVACETAAAVLCF